MTAGLTFVVTFRDFQLLQTHMAKRLFARNRRPHIVALLGVVFCALFLATAIVVSARPSVAIGLFGNRIA